MGSPVLARHLHALLDRRLCRPGDVVMHEFSMHSAVADVFVVQADDYLTGYEIKSEADSLTRLKWQAPVYDRVLDFCWLMVADRLCAASVKKLPEHWGVLRVTRPGGVAIELERPAAINPRRDPEHVAYLLRVTELRDIMRQHSPQKLGRDKGKHAVAEQVLRIDPAVLRREVATRLRTRPADRAEWARINAAERTRRKAEQEQEAAEEREIEGSILRQLREGNEPRSVLSYLHPEAWKRAHATFAADAGKQVA